MTSIHDKLSFDLILPDFKQDTVKQVFAEMSVHTERMIGTPKQFLFDKLWAQEQNQNSAIGNGVAVSHAELPRLTRPFIIFSRLPNLVDFKAPDQEPVDMICLVLSPEQEGTTYLKRLSFVTRAFSDREFCDDLRHADGVNDIRQAIQNREVRQKAA